jgi:pilus assembly protein Flp/PilA
MTTLIRRFLDDEGGATAIEYGLIVALIFLVVVGSVQLFATEATSMFERIAGAIDAVVGGGDET